MTDNSEIPEQECNLCDEGVYVYEDNDKYCDTCQHAPAAETHVWTTEDEWESFWDYRKRQVEKGEWSRMTCVGGFQYPYHQSDGLY